MKYLKQVSAIGLILVACPFAWSKVKRSSFNTKRAEVGVVKGVNGGAEFRVSQTIALQPEINEFQFQNGRLTQEIEFYRSPRCYLHFKSGQEARELPTGKVLKISKIDNIYSNGSVHVTFWFDKDQNISDLLCITNYNHTLTVHELKETLGEAFGVQIPKAVEADALVNTAPQKNAPVLSEDSTTNQNPYARRAILSDS